MPNAQGMRHKLEHILSQLLLRISCCLDKVKPTGVPKMAVRRFNPIASSEFFELCVCIKILSKLCSCIHKIKKNSYRKTLKNEL